MVWWICSGCLKEVEDDPHSHSDWGGKVTIQGPHCEECGGIPMDVSPDQGEDEEGE